MATRRRTPARPRVRPHPFSEAPELADRYVPVQRRGLGPRRWCRRCGLPGEPGDARHPEPDAELLAAAAARDAAITGDRDLPAAA